MKSLLFALSILSLVTLGPCPFVPPPPPPPPPPGPPCTAPVAALAKGIETNHGSQELFTKSSNELSFLAQDDPFDQAQFDAMKANALGNINGAIALNDNNIKIAPAESPAIPGLQALKGQQAAQLAMVTNITRDGMAYAALFIAQTNALKQCDVNLDLAKGGCSVSE